MISVAEPPLEFNPRGRTTVQDHPGTAQPQTQKYLPSENLLLQRLQNVNISATEQQQEFWIIRELYDDSDIDFKQNKRKLDIKEELRRFNGKIELKSQNVFKETVDPLKYDNYVNSEEEIYVNKCTVVWTQGHHDDNIVLKQVSFTTQSPVKFATFVNPQFVRGKRAQINSVVENEKDTLSAICIIDQKSMYTYCNDGEDYLTNLEFSVSQVWPNLHGLLLVKSSGSAVIQNLTIPLPRLYSISHPLDEISPVLLKTAANVTGYMIESEYHIVYSEECSDIILLYDAKIFKHFVSRLRKITSEELSNFISAQQEIQLSQTLHRGNLANSHSFSQSSATKNTGATPKRNLPQLGRSSLSHSARMNRVLSQSELYSSNVFGFSNRVMPETSLSNLQSTMHHMTSIQDIRKFSQAKPAKPIEPILCLEHIWTENTFGTQREFCEMATRGFIHTDMVGQTYLCYLLQRSCRLSMVLMSDYGASTLQFATMASSVSAKDAVCLNRMRMIVVLDPAGSLLIYTGTVLISKVHITPVLTNSVNTHTSNANVNTSIAVGNRQPVKSPNISFPRRSSLLPSSHKNVDCVFEEELHLLSPVHPLPPKFIQRQTNNVCLSLRDPAANRFTLVYTSGRMQRIALPLLNESQLVTRCINALRQLLNLDQYLTFIIRWYSTRHPPGSHNISTEQEWHLFAGVLLSLTGCSTSSQMGINSQKSFNNPASNESKKRRKHNENEEYNDGDWEFMLQTLGELEPHPKDAGFGVDSSAPLFTMLPAIFYCFHLLYEDMKLNRTLHVFMPLMVKFLHQLAVDMQLGTYIYHYVSDCPELANKTAKMTKLTAEHGALMLYQDLLRVAAPSVFAQIEHIMRSTEVMPYHYVHNINELSRNVVQIISLIMHGPCMLKAWFKPLEFSGAIQSNYPKRPKRTLNVDVLPHEQLIQLLLSLDMTRLDIERLPVAIYLIIAEALESARLEPPIGSSAAVYDLILRPELIEHSKLLDLSDKNKSKNKSMPILKEDSLSLRDYKSKVNENVEPPRFDGMDNMDTKLLRLRFPDDMRIEEIRRLLTSSVQVLVDVQQSPGTSDHEFIEEQEKQLFALCSRTLTLPIGRGMFTLRTMMPKAVDNVFVPKLCLSGREPLKGTTVDMNQIEFPTNMTTWPSFHNGVAAGLQISTQATSINSTWIVYQKPLNQVEQTLEHAGFLMALGLNGHLKNLSFMSMYEYLVKCDEMTSVGLLLGISAAHRGTMDNTITKLLSVHIEALLPATALELDIPQNIQVSALMGIGLLYQGSAKRHIAEVLLQEIGRPPGPEMENSVERESYALTSGLALGLVTLGQGESPAGLRDLQLPDTLHYYMIGGSKRPLTGSQKEKYRLASFQVREGENVNIDVTAPGATLALGLMFFDSSNKAIAEWMNPPNTRYMLDLIRPDFLLLRIIARGLIMWKDIDPSEEWLKNQFPDSLLPHLSVPRQTNIFDDNDEDIIDYEAIAQAYCNIIAGAGFCIGLKYAGTENPVAFNTLRKTIKEFLNLPSKPLGEYAGRIAIESALMVLLISISLVSAGSGNCEIIRIVRFLRSRVGPQYPYVTYGSHMALHMSLGLLVLGAGRFTIAKSPASVAILLCAFFPKFPIHSHDNRYHLQALRHLYVLAVEPRLFLPRDIDTNKLCLCKISVLEMNTTELRQLPMAPCMLPELSTLKKVQVTDENYWPVCFERGRNWDQLIKALEHSACIDIKKRTGCLSHLEDPDRLKSLLSQTLTKEQYVCWDIEIKELQRFVSERHVISFIDRFLTVDEADFTYNQLNLRKQLILLFYRAVVKDKMHALPIYLELYKHTQQIQCNPNNYDIWQIKLSDVYMTVINGKRENLLVSREIVQMLVERFKFTLDQSQRELCLQLRHFLSTDILNPSWFSGLNEKYLRRLLAVANFYGLTPNVLSLINLSNYKVAPNNLHILFEFSRKLKMDLRLVFALIKILQMTYF